MVNKKFEKITVDQNICHGKPCILGTRIMVSNILSLIAGGYNFDQIIEYYPELTKEDIKESVEYVLATLENEDVLLRVPV